MSKKLNKLEKIKYELGRHQCAKALNIASKLLLEEERNLFLAENKEQGVTKKKIDIVQKLMQSSMNTHYGYLDYGEKGYVFVGMNMLLWMNNTYGFQELNSSHDRKKQGVLEYANGFPENGTEKVLDLEKLKEASKGIDWKAKRCLLQNKNHASFFNAEELLDAIEILGTNTIVCTDYHPVRGYMKNDKGEMAMIMSLKDI